MKMYNGTVDLQFQEKSHRYKVNGEYVQGVTTILSKVTPKDGLINWAANMAVQAMLSGATPEEAKKAHTRKKEAGADTGTLVHKHIEAYLSGTPTPLPEDPKAVQAIEAFYRWEKDNDPGYIFSERIVYSKQYHYAGCADVAFELDGKKYLADFKTADPRREWKNGYTGKLSAYPEHFIQCAAYDIAYSEEKNVVVQDWTGVGEVTLSGIQPEPKHFDAYMIIYVTKSGQLHTFTLDSTEVAREAWIHALGLARAVQSLDKL